MIEDFVGERGEQNRQVEKINLLKVIRPADQSENILKYDEDWDDKPRHKKAKSLAVKRKVEEIKIEEEEVESVKEEEWISIIKGEREFSAISKKRLR